jgi:polar amino acid transport system permease protein
VDYVFQFGVVWREFDALLLGAWLTVRLSALAMVLGLVVGVAGALATLSRWRSARAVARTYVEAIRNTPFLVQVLFVYLGLPSIGLRLRPDQAALLAMVINLGAYATEIVRAGVKAVPAGQLEAGTALGLSQGQLFRHVVWLPALRAIFPALGSQFILIMLASSVVSVISAEELTAVADTIVARNFRSFEVYLVVTGLYLAMSLTFQAAFAAIHRALFARWGGA